MPIYDAYKNLISNNVIDSTKFAAADEDTVQHDVYQEFLSEQERAIPEIQQALGSNTAFEDLSDTMQSYIRYKRAARSPFWANGSNIRPSAHWARKDFDCNVTQTVNHKSPNKGLTTKETPCKQKN